MDFKKDWNKVVTAVLLLVAAVFWFLALLEVGFDDFAYTCEYLAGLVFFLGSAIYVICKMLGYDFAKYVILGVGFLATIFMLIYFIANLEYVFEFIEDTAWDVGALVVFALLPLIKGIKKVMVMPEVTQSK